MKSVIFIQSFLVLLSTISLVSCASRQLENNNSHNLDVSSIQIKASDSGPISQALTYEEILNKAIAGEETKIILVAKTYNYSGGRSRTVMGTDPYANFYFEEVPYNEEEYLYLDDNISICSSGVMEMSLTYSDSAIKATFLSYGVMQYLSGEFTFSDYKADAVEYTIINNSGEINLMDPSGAYLYYDSDNGLGQNDIPSDFAFYPIDDYFVNTYNVWGWMLNSFDDSDASTLLSQYRQITALDKYFIQAYIETSAAGAVAHEGDVANNWSTFTSHVTTYQNMTSGNFTCGDVSSSDLTINYEKLQFELTGDVDNLFYMDATSGDYSSLEKTLSGGWDFGTAQISGTIYLKYGANLDYADTFSENALEVTVNQTINIEASEYAFTTKTYTVGTNDTVLALFDDSIEIEPDTSDYGDNMFYAAIDKEFFDQYGLTPADIPINRINWQEDPTIITYHDLDYIERNLIADKGYVLLTRIGINDASLGSSTIYHYMSFYTDTAWQGKCNRLLVENYSYYQSLLNSQRFSELQYYFPDELLANVDEIKVAIQGFQGEFDEEGLNEYLSTMSIENRNYKEFSYYLIRYKGIFYRQQYVDGQSVEQLFINAADEFYAKYESDFDHAVMDQDVDNIINTLDSLVNNYSLLDSYKERLVDATNKWLKAHLVEDVEVVMEIYNTLDIYIERIASIDATLNEEEVNKQAKAIMEEYIAYLRGFFANMGE